jgi:antitoxin (DNA-binding transcriptional repressor) of toxin-antitoxin stability system
MEKATIAQLKNRLSAYLRLVREGKTVLVYERDRPVARLEKLDNTLDADIRVRRLESRGIVNRATQAIPFEILKQPAPKAKSSVVAALLEDRREER